MRIWLLALLCATGAGYAQEQTLVFDTPMTAVLNARQWDKTGQAWGRKPDEYYFDAVHRFLLARFPGCAAAVQARLRDGYALASARLALTFKDQEFMRVAGYAWRGYVYQDKPAPQWHARATLLRQPWIDDATLGPTWNAFLNGAGYWRMGGARDPSADRESAPLGEAGLWKEQPEGVFDLTPLLTGDPRAFWTRMAQVEYAGFLIQKVELSNNEYGENGLSTGVARIFVTAPKLVFTFRKGTMDAPGAPVTLDVAARADELRENGGGLPTTRIPENLAELGAAHRARRLAAVPEWSRPHLDDLWNLPPHWGYEHGYDWFTRTCKNLGSGDRALYQKAVDEILACPPGWGAGHQAIEYSLPLLAYDDLLPDVARYHLRMDCEARWQFPLAPDKVFTHGKVTGVGTLNHMAQSRPTALLAAEITDKTELAEMAELGLWELSRWMIYSDGYNQEHGDSYYHGIAMAPLQAAAKYSRDPLMRLNASLMVEKLLLEDIATFHPALRKRVSRISRRMGPWPEALMEQDVAEGAMHTLSRSGALLELDAPGEPKMTQGLHPFNFHATPALRTALMAPWGAPWEANAIDRKPLPFRAVFSTRVMGRVTEPIHALTYMGRHYGLASEEAYTSACQPLFAAWQRGEAPSTKFDDLGVLTIQGRLNEQPPAALEQTPFGILQHDNKLIYAMHAPEIKLLQAGESNFPPVAKEGLTSLKCAVNIYTFGPDDARELWVGGEKVTKFPATARLGEMIALREGTTFIGLISLPATNLGRRDEVVITQEHPLLQISAYLYQSEKPLPDLEAIKDANAGWVVEFADAEDYPSFAEFRRHLGATTLRANWEAAVHTLHVTYTSGRDTLEMGFRTDFEREMLWHKQYDPSKIFAYQRVNGAWPWPDQAIELDCPLGQMGKSGRLEKGGAKLETLAGQMALLRVEPVSGTCVGINPYPEPVPFALTTPEGAVVRADGPLTMGRVTVCPRAGTLAVDCVLPPAEGIPALERLQKQRGNLFRPGVDLGAIRRDAARTLLVRGFAAEPKLILNGTPVAGPFTQPTLDGITWWRVPIAEP